MQADIFFFIASVGIVLLTFLVCLILYQVFKIVRSIRRIITRIEEGSDVIAEDVAQLRAYVMEGSLISQLISFFMPRGMRRKRRTIDSDEDE